MKVLSRGHMVAVDRWPTSEPMAPPAPSYAGRGSVELLSDVTGRKAHVRYAVIARSNPWVMASVNERAALASRVPLHVYRPDPAGRSGHRERVRAGDTGPGEHLARLLAHPEDRVSGRKLRRRLVGDVLVHANSLAEFVYDGAQIAALRWHPWASVEPLLSDDGLRVQGFKVPVSRRFWTITSGQTRTIDATDALHLAINDDTETPLGVSPLASLHATHALHEAAWRFARHYLEEGIFPSAVIELPHQATLAQAKLTRELIKDLHSGVERAGKPGVLGFGKWQQISATPEGAKLVELAKASREEVSAAFRVPRTALGDLESANKASAESARVSFIRDVVGDDVGVVETEVNAQLVAPRRRWAQAGVFVEAQLGELLRPDMEALSKVIARQVGAPVMSINDGRRLINLPPLDDPIYDEIILNPGTPGTAGMGDEGKEDDTDGKARQLLVVDRWRPARRAAPAGSNGTGHSRS